MNVLRARQALNLLDPSLRSRVGCPMRTRCILGPVPTLPQRRRVIGRRHAAEPLERRTNRTDLSRRRAPLPSRRATMRTGVAATLERRCVVLVARGSGDDLLSRQKPRALLRSRNQAGRTAAKEPMAMPSHGIVERVPEESGDDPKHHRQSPPPSEVAGDS